MSVQYTNKFEEQEVDTALARILDDSLKFSFSGGVNLSRFSAAGDISASDAAGNDILGVTDTSSARTVTLPDADNEDGNVKIVNDESNAASTNGITVTTESGDIDGGANVSISSNSGSVRAYSDGTNWFTF